MSMTALLFFLACAPHTCAASLEDSSNECLSSSDVNCFPAGVDDSGDDRLLSMDLLQKRMETHTSDDKEAHVQSMNETEEDVLEANTQQKQLLHRSSWNPSPPSPPAPTPPTPPRPSTLLWQGIEVTENSFEAAMDQVQRNRDCEIHTVQAECVGSCEWNGDACVATGDETTVPLIGHIVALDVLEDVNGDPLETEICHPEPYSAERCRQVLEGIGFTLGDGDYPFEAGYSVKGCYAYSSGEYSGTGWYGGDATIGGAEMQTVPSPPKFRPTGYDQCGHTYATADVPGYELVQRGRICVNRYDETPSGGPLQHVSDCKQRCDQDADCQGFSFNPVLTASGNQYCVNCRDVEALELDTDAWDTYVKDSIADLDRALSRKSR